MPYSARLFDQAATVGGQLAGQAPHEQIIVVGNQAPLAQTSLRMSENSQNPGRAEPCYQTCSCFGEVRAQNSRDQAATRWMITPQLIPTQMIQTLNRRQPRIPCAPAWLPERSAILVYQRTLTC